MSSSQEVWQKLEQEFRGDKKVSTVLLQSLRKQYANMKMKDCETIKNYYTRIMSLVSEMKAYGEDLSDHKVVEKILISLPAKFDPKVSTIEDTKDLSTLTITELISSLHAFEQRLASRDEDSMENAFQSKLNIRSQSLNRGGGKEQENSRRVENSRSLENKKGKIKQYPPCGICKRNNHLEKDCWH